MRTRRRFGETRCALFAPSFKAFCRRSKRQKRDFLKILMKRTRVETESDENRLSTDEVALLVFLFFAGPSFLFFFKKFFEFCGSCSSLFSFFFSLFFFFFSPLLLLFSRVRRTPEFYVARVKVVLSFFLSFRASVFEERERREREETKPKFASLIRFLRC